MKVSFQIEGAAELERNLATLGQRLHRKVIRQAVRAAQKPVLDASKRNARSMVGGQMGELLAKSLVITAPKRQRPGSYALHVQHITLGAARRRKRKITIRQGGGRRLTVRGLWHETQSGRRYYLPAVLEYGHVTGSTPVAAVPYRRQAAESTRNESIRLFSRALRTGLLREAMIARSR